MGKLTRALLAGACAMLAAGTLSACGGGSSTDATNTSGTDATAGATSAQFPQAATFIADMDQNGTPMTIGITVDGGDITAYACNGTDDEAWFFGNQTDSRIDITSRFRDTLKASFDGTDVEGDLTMNGVTYDFTATAAEPPAGVYTAEADGVRSSWIVRADGSAIGVQSSGISGRDFEQAELQILKDQQFRDQVRNKRQLQQAAQIQRLQNGSGASTINGKQVVAVLVNGNFRF